MTMRRLVGTSEEGVVLGCTGVGGEGGPAVVSKELSGMVWYRSATGSDGDYLPRL